MTNPIDPEPGETWRCRGGRVAVIMRLVKFFWPIEGAVDGEFHVWKENGKWAGGDHPLDLISRITPAPEQPAVTPPEPVATLRDQFAMAAPKPPASWWDNGQATCAGLAQWNYQFADAMMAARKEQPCPTL